MASSAKTTISSIEVIGFILLRCYSGVFVGLINHRPKCHVEGDLISPFFALALPPIQCRLLDYLDAA